jgi:hypothetical protein
MVSSFGELGRPNLLLANQILLRYLELGCPKYPWTMGLSSDGGTCVRCISTMIRILGCTCCLLLVWLTFLTLVSAVAGLAHPNSSPKKRWQRIPILQYHDEWVCVNKPAGLTVHRSRTTPKSSPVLTTAVKRQLAR